MRPVSRRESDAILGAMRQVALAGGNRCQEKGAVSLGERREIGARDPHASDVQ